MCVTEVDSGKFHSTMPLWGYIAVKHLSLPWYANLADLYVRLGLGEERPAASIPRTDLIPEGYYLLRDMDVGRVPLEGGRLEGEGALTMSESPRPTSSTSTAPLATIPVDWEGVQEGLRSVTG